MNILTGISKLRGSFPLTFFRYSADELLCRNGIVALMHSRCDLTVCYVHRLNNNSMVLFVLFSVERPSVIRLSYLIFVSVILLVKVGSVTDFEDLKG